ncbi:MAG: hypothetical protein ACEY3D_02150 [Rickettsia sp.]
MLLFHEITTQPWLRSCCMAQKTRSVSFLRKQESIIKRDKSSF